MLTPRPYQPTSTRRQPAGPHDSSHDDEVNGVLCHHIRITVFGGSSTLDEHCGWWPRGRENEGGDNDDDDDDDNDDNDDGDDDNDDDYDHEKAYR